MAAAAAAAAGGAAACMEMDDFYAPRRTASATQSSSRPPPVSRQKSRMEKYSKSMQKSVVDFFLGEETPPRDEKDVARSAAHKWQARCQRLHSNALLGGKVKEDEIAGARSIDTLDNSVFEASQGTEDMRNMLSAAGAGRKTPQPYDPLHRPYRRQMSRSSKGSYYGNAVLNRQYSHLSTASSSRRSMRNAPSRRSRKPSVLNLAMSGITGKSAMRSRKPTPKSRSFAPESISTYQDDAESLKSPAVDSLFSPGEEIDDVFFNTPLPTSPYAVGVTRHPLAGVTGPMSSSPAAQLTPTGTGDELLPPIQERSRISEIQEESQDIHKTGDLDEGDGHLPPAPPPVFEHNEGDLVTSSLLRNKQEAPEGGAEMREISGRKRGSRPPPLSMELAQGDTAVKVDSPEAESDGDTLLRPTEHIFEKPMKGGWQRGRQGPLPLPGTPDYLGMDLVDSAGLVDGIDGVGRALKDAVYDWDNSDRREVGKGFVGNLFDREYKENLPSEVEEQIDDFDEHRPYFTYWATFVQIVIYIVAVAVYGIAPLGFEETEISGEVLKPSLAIERVSYFEKDNLWIGPRQADLIHLGARYSPCMRRDDNVVRAIEQDRDIERKTACCVRNDGSGCHQTSFSTCSSTLSYWQNWTIDNPGPDGRLSGSVCGQNPDFCKQPISSGAYEWPDDITKWPICQVSIPASAKPENMHMTCKLQGRPCCVGIQGACIITTREYCEFRRGYFHEEATLCSQISCMSEICGMIPFRIDDKPDQFYRLWTSLFLHAGLFQLLVTVLFQFFVMRDIEKLAGWHRTAIIYIGSGIAGSLASATFLPYHVEAGPAGSQFGIIACLFAELFQNWAILKHPGFALAKQLGLLLFLFIMGLLPYVDNYAHLFGFLFGFLLSFALLPFIKLNACDRRGKCVGVIICLIAACGLFTGLVIMFYVSPIYSCPNCHYFNCIPFTNKFCQNMEVRIGRHEIY